MKDTLLPRTEDLYNCLKNSSGELKDVRNLSGQVRTEVHSLLANIKAPQIVIDDVGKLDKAVQFLKEVFEFLSNFPLVGGFCGVVYNFIDKIILPPLDTIKTTLSNLKKDILDEVDAELEQFQSTFDDIERTAHEAADIVDKIIEAIYLLIKGVHILNDLAKLCGRQDLLDELHRIAADIDGISDKILNETDTLTGALSDLNSRSRKLISATDPAQKSLALFVQTVIQPVGKLLSHLNGFNSVCSSAKKALRPIEWALKVAEWIMKKVIMPVVNWILDKLHLRDLANNFQKAVEKFLGIDKIKNFISDAKSNLEGLAANVFRDVVDQLTRFSGSADKVQSLAKQYSDQPIQARFENLAKQIASAPVKGT